MIGRVRWLTTVANVEPGESVTVWLANGTPRKFSVTLPCSTFSVEPGDEVMLTLEPAPPSGREEQP